MYPGVCFELRYLLCLTPLRRVYMRRLCVRAVVESIYQHAGVFVIFSVIYQSEMLHS